MIKILFEKNYIFNNKEIIIDMVKMIDNENIIKLIGNYYGVEINEDNSLSE